MNKTPSLLRWSVTYSPRRDASDGNHTVEKEDWVHVFWDGNDEI